MLLGRERELRHLGDLVDGLPVEGATVVVRGEPGAGKSALLERARHDAHTGGARVLHVGGVQAETQMPFAALHHLLQPVLDHVAELPERQRGALLSAFGTSSATPDLFLVALATLSLLAELAGAAPVMVVADDAQWIDGATCDVLTFVARRLDSDPILLVAAVREGFRTAFDEGGFPTLTLAGLPDDDARALLDARAPGLASALHRRVLAEAAGNPLALIELPVAWKNVDPAMPADSLPLTTRLERAFAARSVTLPSATRTIVLVASLNDSQSVQEALDAAAKLLSSRPHLTDLTPAERAGLIGIDGSALTFRHPLVRSAIRLQASTAERSEAHRALAEALRHDADRSVWHRAASATGPDEDVARSLEATASRAVRRGGLAVAAAALERSAELTVSPLMRGTRMIGAAELEFRLGRLETATRLLRAVNEGDIDQTQRDRHTLLREYIRDSQGSGTSTEFVDMAARTMDAGEVELALDAVVTAALKALWFDGPRAEREAIVTVAERLPVSELNPKLLAALALADPLGRGATVIERLGDVQLADYADPEDLRFCGIALVIIPEYELAGRFLAAAVDGLRDQGRLVVLARALGSQALAALFCGDFALTEQAAEEGIRLCAETGQTRWESSCRTFLAHVCAVRGQTERAETQITEAERLLLPPRSTPGIQHFQLARAATSMAGGEPDVAFDQLARLFDPSDPVYNPLIASPGLIDLADAAVAIDRVTEAAVIVNGVEPLAVATRSASVETKVRYARAVLAPPDQAEGRFTAALESSGPASLWERARLQLAYGIWLRRQRRVSESRRPLRIAYEGFDAVGALPWSERARQELRASGERVRRRLPEMRDALTAQELQIAELAAGGLSNREIGQRLFLSHRTVGNHLYRIFPKLGITSRAELTRT